jgi:small subunit ribosomal protein S18
MAKPPLRKPKKKVCVFCQEKIVYVDYKDTGLLRKYISDRGKIRARRVTGNCTRTSATSRPRSRTRARWRCCRTPARLR